MQTGTDYAFYYHFNDAILAARPALARLPLANVLKLSELANWTRTTKLNLLDKVAPSAQFLPFGKN